MEPFGEKLVGDWASTVPPLGAAPPFSRRYQPVTVQEANCETSPVLLFTAMPPRAPPLGFTTVPVLSNARSQA
jgi:hypothetical protein